MLNLKELLFQYFSERLENKPQNPIKTSHEIHATCIRLQNSCFKIHILTANWRGGTQLKLLAPLQIWSYQKLYTCYHKQNCQNLRFVWLLKTDCISVANTKCISIAISIKIEENNDIDWKHQLQDWQFSNITYQKI